jgi:hypothetical protein
MHSHASFPAEDLCTCGYLTTPAKIHVHDASPDQLTYQIGSLLIALGKMFDSVPLFRVHMQANTSKLLISIGRKLVHSSKGRSRLVS